MLFFLFAWSNGTTNSSYGVKIDIHYDEKVAAVNQLETDKQNVADGCRLGLFGQFTRILCGKCTYRLDNGQYKCFYQENGREMFTNGH